MENISLWKDISEQSSPYPQLEESIEVDVAIIGGGITGLTAAIQLTNAGKKVAILEAGRVGENTTGYSTGNLYVLVQPYYQNIQKKFSLETAEAVAHSRQFAIDYIEKMTHNNNIDCHFTRRPSYLFSDDEKRISLLENEVALLKKIGMTIDFIDELPLSFKFKKAAIMENQARFNPLQYTIGLAKSLRDKCDIFENTRVESIEENKSVCKLKTSGGSVVAKKVIIATHTPIGISATHLYTAPYRSYVVAAHLKDNVYPEGHFWSVDDPHFITSTHSIHASDPELLMVAGNHHKTGQGPDTAVHYENIEKYLHKNFEISEIAYRWSAQHYQSADDIPYIGLANPSTKNIYMATGYFADGLVYGTLAGIILSDIISNKENSLAEVYNSTRFKPIASAAFLIKENTNLFLQYLKDFPLLSKNNYNNIKAGHGEIVEIDQEKWAVSRDADNQLHAVSAVCTHMQGIVNWNNAEKTWDCPCHGSRFTSNGSVIEGPAVTDLKKKTLND